MEMGSGAVTAVSDTGDPLSSFDGLFGFDLDGALFEVSEQGEELGGVLDQDVVSEGILFVGATGWSVGVMAFDGVDLAVSGGINLFGESEETFVLVWSAAMDAVVAVDAQEIEGKALGCKEGSGGFAESMAMGGSGSVSVGDPPAATDGKAEVGKGRGLGLDGKGALKGARALLEVKAEEQGIGGLMAWITKGREGQDKIVGGRKVG